MKLAESLHVFSAVLSDDPFGAVDYCLGIEILDQPDKAPVAILVEEFRP